MDKFEYLLSDLDEYGVWENGIDGRPCHVESYMTCINYPKIEKALEELRDKYTLENWKYFVEQCDWYVYLTPMYGLLKGEINRRILMPLDKS